MENYSTLSRDKTFQKRAWKIVLTVVAIVAALYFIIYFADNKFGSNEPSGDAGSSFATVSSGAKAWSDLLIINDYDVSRDTGRVTLPEIDYDTDFYYEEVSLNRKTSTLVILNGALPKDEAEEVSDFVSDGGRLITDNPNLLEKVLSVRHDILLDGEENLEASNIDGMENINNVKGSGIGSIDFDDTITAQPLLEGQSNTISAAIFSIGYGDVIALPDTGVVSNGLLDQQDNALFSLRIAGASGSKVVFGEGVHGYKDANGFDGLPFNAKLALVGLLGALIIYVSSTGRRFGVGEEPHRDLGPRRIFFAHALANSLRKNKTSGTASRQRDSKV